MFVSSGKLCFGYGWKNTAIRLSLIHKYQTYDCYKVLTDNVSYLFGGATDETKLEAKWIDNCQTSIGNGGEIPVYTWDLSNDEFEHMILGETDVDKD